MIPSSSPRKRSPRMAPALLSVVLAVGCLTDETIRDVAPPAKDSGATPVLTRVGDTFFLDDEALAPFGLRAVNVLQSDAIADRMIASLPGLREHGMQSVVIGLQGGRHTEGGNSAFNAFEADGTLRAAYRDRLARVLDALAAARMVGVVNLFYRGRDEELRNAEAVRTAVRATVRFLLPWRNVWVQVINEPGHDGFDHAILTGSDGQRELYGMAKSEDPDRIVYVSHVSGANDGFRADTWGRNGIGSSMERGDVCVEYERHDSYSSPGVFDASDRDLTVAHAEDVLGIPAYFFYHAAWHQKADFDGWPRFDKGGAGTSADPGVAVLWNAMRDLRPGP